MKSLLLTCFVASLVALGVAPASAEPGASRALAIVKPSEQQTIFASGGKVVIALAANPPLEEGERIVVRVDDQVMVLPSGMTKVGISDLPNGEHVVEAIVVDADSNPIAAAENVIFEVGLEVWI